MDDGITAEVDGDFILSLVREHLVTKLLRSLEKEELGIGDWGLGRLSLVSLVFLVFLISLIPLLTFHAMWKS
jgi:hypothetical protein